MHQESTPLPTLVVRAVVGAGLLLCLAGGCRSDARPLSAVPTSRVEQNLPPEAVRITPPRPDALATSASKPTEPPQPNPPPSTGQPTPAAAASPNLEQMLDAMAAVAPLDEAARRQWRHDLSQTDPKLWPMLLDAYRASADFRRQGTGNPAQQAQQVEQAAQQMAMNVLAAAHGPAGKSNNLAAMSGSLLPPGTSAVQQVSAHLPLPIPPPTSTATAPPAQPDPAAVEPPPAAASLESNGTTTSIGVNGHGTTSPPATSALPTGDALASAIAQWEAAAGAAAPGDVHPHAYLRMMYLAAGRRDDALRPIPHLPPAEQEFWKQQLIALATYLDAARQPDAARRAAEARLYLNQAGNRLAEQAALLVRGLTFCTEVQSYGVCTRFEEYEFQAGQQVLLYAELENFKSESTPQGFHTSLVGSYQILDRQGRRVTHADLPELEEYCQNERRDYFVRYFITLPDRFYAGNYTLQLTLEDRLARKIGQASIEFVVKD